tara:strand:+ start:186 stop:365 length:180 start_codon:yes stop_codon:yes gene_type:complete
MARSKATTKKKKDTKTIASGNFTVGGKPGDRSRSTRQKSKQKEVRRQDMMIKYMQHKKV